MFFTSQLISVLSQFFSRHPGFLHSQCCSSRWRLLSSWSEVVGDSLAYGTLMWPACTLSQCLQHSLGIFGADQASTTYSFTLNYITKEALIRSSWGFHGPLRSGVRKARILGKWDAARWRFQAKPSVCWLNDWEKRLSLTIYWVSDPYYTSPLGSKLKTGHTESSRNIDRQYHFSCAAASSHNTLYKYYTKRRPVKYVHSCWPWFGFSKFCMLCFNSLVPALTAYWPPPLPPRDSGGGGSPPFNRAHHITIDYHHSKLTSDEPTFTHQVPGIRALLCSSLSPRWNTTWRPSQVLILKYLVKKNLLCVFQAFCSWANAIPHPCCGQQTWPQLNLQCHSPKTFNNCLYFLLPINKQKSLTCMQSP